MLKASRLLEERGIDAELIKLNFLNPLDTAAVLSSLRKTGRLLTAEEVCAFGSIGSRLLEACAREKLVLKACKTLDLGSGLVPQGGPEELLEMKGLDAESLAQAAAALCEEGKAR